MNWSEGTRSEKSENSYAKKLFHALVPVEPEMIAQRENFLPWMDRMDILFLSSGEWGE